MAKLIHVTGAAGSGRRTFACNLACILDRMERRVLLISANETCGDIQTFFDEAVDSEHGIEKAINDNIGQNLKKAVRVSNPKLKQLDLLCIPDSGREIKGEGYEETRLSRFIREADSVYSYIILISDLELQNDLAVYYGLLRKSITICMYRPAVRTLHWMRAAKEILLTDFNKHPINVISDLGVTFSAENFTKIVREADMQAEFHFRLPWVTDCDGYENRGVPIVLEKNEKTAVRYRRCIQDIAEFIEDADSREWEC